MTIATAAQRAGVPDAAHDLVSTVRSSTQPGTWYTVTLGLDGVYTCTCPAGERGFLGCKRRGHCKHVEAELQRYAALTHVGSSASALKMYDEVADCRACGKRRHAVTVEQTRDAQRKVWTTVCACGARSTTDLTSPHAQFVN